MSAPNPWLPDLVTMAQYGNNWEKYDDAVYRDFHREIIQASLQCHGVRVSIPRKEVRGRGERYTHLTTEGVDRLPAIRRCERLKWIKAIIEAAGDPSKGVVSWIQPNGHIGLALSDFSYVIFLQEKTDQQDIPYLVLLTAYPVEGRWADKYKAQAAGNPYPKRVTPPL